MTGHSDILTEVALGAAGDFAGAMVLQTMMAAGRRWRPATLPPLRQGPGEFLVKRAEVVAYNWLCRRAGQKTA
jgi:hypothetical protein